MEEKLEIEKLTKAATWASKDFGIACKKIHAHDAVPVESPLVPNPPVRML